MANPQVVEYIKKSREAGISDNAIRQALLGSGFSVQDIEEAMSTLGAETNVLENMQNQKPLFPDQPQAVSPGRFSFRMGGIGRIAKIIVIILIILVGLIGGYFALGRYFPQYAKYVQPYLGSVLNPVINGINSVKNNLPFIGSTPAPVPISSPTPPPVMPTPIAPSPTPARPPQVLDSDSDGLFDSDEARYGTDPNKSDTDGDGYLDGEEVRNGYNPLGPGRATP